MARSTAKVTADDAVSDERPGPRVGIAVAPLRQRRYQPQPARFVVGAAFDAERARGEPGDLIVLAVDPDQLADVLALVRGAVGELVTVGEPG